MQIYDILMIVILVGAAGFGAYKGLAWQIASLASIFVSYWVALNFRGQLAPLMPVDAPWNTFAAMLVLYLACSLAIWLIFNWVRELIDRVKLREFDRQIGALVGLAKGLLLCIIVTLFAMTLLGDNHKKSIVHSYSGYYIALLLDHTHTLMPEEVHDVLHPYIHSLDDGLDASHHHAHAEGHGDPHHEHGASSHGDVDDGHGGDGESPELVRDPGDEHEHWRPDWLPGSIPASLPSWDELQPRAMD